MAIKQLTFVSHIGTGLQDAMAVAAATHQCDKGYAPPARAAATPKMSTGRDPGALKALRNSDCAVCKSSVKPQGCGWLEMPLRGSSY